jgi:hypothetical protein
MDNWQELNTAPKDEPVLICLNDCARLVGIQLEINEEDEKGKKIKRVIWVPNEKRYLDSNFFTKFNILENVKVWQPLPMPPKHLYEKKLAADVLQKQVDELRK